MSNYQTNNPVPSIDPRDLDDNATVFDLLLNSEDPSVPDRLQVPRKTWHQMELDAEALVSPNVAALASLTGAADRGFYFTGSGAMALYVLSSLGRTLGGIANAAAGRAALTAAVSGANADITSLTGLTTPLSTAQGGTGNATGLAATATALANSRSISATGDATWTVNFDGTANATAALTLAASGVSAGTYGSVTVNAKGLVTAASTITPIANGGTGQSTTAGHLADLQTAGAYGKTNVLGTVSQTAGVPTGSLLETGGTLSGTGKYFKYADGRMTIIKTLAVATGSTTAKGSIFGSAATSASNFAVAFVGNVPVVQVSGTDDAGGGWAAMDIFPTLTTWGSYSTRAHVSQGASGTIYLTADGRWF